jgi:hypothetical protein
MLKILQKRQSKKTNNLSRNTQFDNSNVDESCECSIHGQNKVGPKKHFDFNEKQATNHNSCFSNKRNCYAHDESNGYFQSRSDKECVSNSGNHYAESQNAPRTYYRSNRGFKSNRDWQTSVGNRFNSKFESSPHYKNGRNCKNFHAEPNIGHISNDDTSNMQGKDSLSRPKGQSCQ